MKKIFALLFFALVISAVVPQTANAVTREQCLDGTSQYEAEPECLAYLRGEDPWGENEITSFSGLIGALRRVLNTIVPFLVAIAVFIIIWGVFKYISGAADEEQRAQAKQFIVWGVVGVFIMTSIWGLVNILVNTLPLKKTPVQMEGSIFPE